MSANTNGEKMQVVKSASDGERKLQYARIMERSKELNEKLKELFSKEQYPSIGYIKTVMGYNISGKALMRKLHQMQEFFNIKEYKANLLISRKKKEAPVQEEDNMTPLPKTKAKKLAEFFGVKKLPDAEPVKKAAKKAPVKTAKKSAKKATPAK